MKNNYMLIYYNMRDLYLFKFKLFICILNMESQIIDKKKINTFDDIKDLIDE